MQSGNDQEHGRSQPASPVLTAAVIIYVTLALLMVAIPQSLVSWLRDFNPNAVQEVLLVAAEGLEKASSRIGANVPYRRGRALFLDITGKNED